MSDIVERLRSVQSTCVQYAAGSDIMRDAADEIELRDGLLREARQHDHRITWCACHVCESLRLRIDAALGATADQPTGPSALAFNADTQHSEGKRLANADQPSATLDSLKGECAFCNGTGRGFPIHAGPTPSPQPDAAASTFADCELAMGMEYETSQSGVPTGADSCGQCGAQWPSCVCPAADEVNADPTTACASCGRETGKGHDNCCPTLDQQPRDGAA